MGRLRGEQLPLLLFELLAQILVQGLVEVLASQVLIATGRADHLETFSGASEGKLAIGTQYGTGVTSLPVSQNCCDWFDNTGDTNGVAPDPANSNLIALTTFGQGTQIWDVRHRRAIVRLSSQAADGIAFSTDGDEVAVGGDDGNVRVFDAHTGALKMTLPGTGSGVFSVAFSRQGDRVVAGSEDGTIRLWQLATRQLLTLFAASRGDVESVCFSHDGSEIVAGSDDGTVRVWKAQPPELREQFDVSPGSAPKAVLAAEYSPSNDRVVAVANNGPAYVLKSNGTPVSWHGKPVILGTDSVNSAQFDSRGDEIVTANDDGTVRVYSATPNGYGEVAPSSRIDVDEYKGDSGDAAVYAAFSPNRRHIVVTTNDANALVYQTRAPRPQPLNLNPAVGSSLSAVAYSPDGKIIATADYGGGVQLWRASTGKLLLKLSPSGGASIVDLKFSQSGTELGATSDGGTVSVWTMAHDLPAQPRRPIEIDEACTTPNAASFSPDGTMIVVACSDGSARVFSGKHPAAADGHAAPHLAVDHRCAVQSIRGQHPHGIIRRPGRSNPGLEHRAGHAVTGEARGHCGAANPPRSHSIRDEDLLAGHRLTTAGAGFVERPRSGRIGFRAGSEGVRTKRIACTPGSGP